MTEDAESAPPRTILQPTRNGHHLWFTRKAYTSKLEVDFRTLPCALIDMDYWAHQLIHEVPNSHLKGLYEPPRKPRTRIMELFVYRHRAKQCPCNHDTVRVSVFELVRPSPLETYHLPCAYMQIHPEQLRLVRTHYRENLRVTPANRLIYQGEHLEYLEAIHGIGICSCHHATRHIELTRYVRTAA